MAPSLITGRGLKWPRLERTANRLAIWHFNWSGRGLKRSEDPFKTLDIEWWAGRSTERGLKQRNRLPLSLWLACGAWPGCRVRVETRGVSHATRNSAGVIPSLGARHGLKRQYRQRSRPGGPVGGARPVRWARIETGVYVPIWRSSGNRARDLGGN